MYLPSINTPDGIRERDTPGRSHPEQPGSNWIEARLAELERRLDRARELLELPSGDNTSDP